MALKHNSISFSMHPRWVSGKSLDAFLEPLRENGLSALEFLLDPWQADWAQFDPLIRLCLQQGLYLSFHAPYGRRFPISGYRGAEKAGIQAAYGPMLSLAEGWAAENPGPTTVVIHGGKADGVSRLDLREDTRELLLWALDSFPHLKFALENTGPADPGVVKIGEQREEVFELVEQIDHPRLGICWDLGHDGLHGREEAPSDAWLSRVIHVHVHDLDEQGVDHYPLIFGRVPYVPWLRKLCRTGFSGIVCLEIKGHQLAGRAPQEIHEILTRSVAALREVLSS